MRPYFNLPVSLWGKTVLSTAELITPLVKRRGVNVKRQSLPPFPLSNYSFSQYANQIHINLISHIDNLRLRIAAIHAITQISVGA